MCEEFRRNNEAHCLLSNRRGDDDENKVKQNFQDEKNRIEKKHTYREGQKKKRRKKNKEIGGSKHHRPEKMVDISLILGFCLHEVS